MGWKSVMQCLSLLFHYKSHWREYVGKKYMRFLSEMRSRTVLICIFLYLLDVTSHHFVTTTGICIPLGEGVNGLAEIKRGVLTLL